MTSAIYASIALSLVLLAGTAVIAVRSQPRDYGLVCLRETWLTTVLALMLIALGLAVCAMKLIDPSLAGEEADSWWFAAGFNLVCQVLGDFTLLFALSKKVVAFADRIETISVLGKRREVAWEDVVRVEKAPMSRSVKLTDRQGNVISINGESRDYAKFTQLAKEKIRPAQGRELLEQVESRLRRGR